MFFTLTDVLRACPERREDCLDHLRYESIDRTKLV
jgi:hypothetical protein